MGLPMDIVVGLLGAALAGLLAGVAGIAVGGGLQGRIVVAFVGALLLPFAVLLVFSRGRFSHR